MTNEPLEQLGEKENGTTVWFIRHGHPEAIEGKCYGQYDVGLSTEGLRQARQLSSQLAHQALARIYCSSLRRAIETARILAQAGDLQVEIRDAFCEIHFGDLEGLPYREIQTRYPAVFESWMTRPTETQFPNGENFGQMQERVLNAVEILIERHRGEAIAVVTHSGVIRMLVARALSIPDSEIFRLAQSYGAINRIDYFQSGAIVGLINGVTI